MKRYLLAILVSLGVAALQAADTVYVKTGSTPEAPYDTEEKAFATLQDAVSYAVTESSVKKIHIVGTQTLTAKVTLADIEVFGDSRTATTITGSGGIKPLVEVGDNVLLRDLKISHSDRQGTAGAVFNMTGDRSVISNCWIAGALTKTVGTPIAGVASAGWITHCLFSGNNSNNGGESSTSDNCYGLGILGLSGTARMVNSVFTGNYHNGSIRGPMDGTLSISGSAVLENCVVYGNYVKASSGTDGDGTERRRPRRGAGVFVVSGSPVIRNCIIRNNLKPLDWVEDPGDVDIWSPTVEGDINIRAGATPIIENCNVPEGQVPEGAVDCQTDLPGFTDAAGGDFSIAADSPCVDAGRFQGWQASATDYTGVTPRYQGEGVDIGAYEAVKPTPPTVHIEFGGTLTAEKYATATMSAFVTGLKVDSGATFKWYTSDPQEGTPEPFAVGSPAERLFTEGSWSIYLKIENADGAGMVLYESVENAVIVTRGADYYVSSKGKDTNSGDIDAPFKTLTNAMAHVAAGQRIKIVDQLEEIFGAITLENVEIYGDGWAKSGISHVTGTAVQESHFVLKDGAALSGLKIFGGNRVQGGVIRSSSDSAVVSNCWIYGNIYTTGGNPAGVFTAGLITHSLFTANRNNNSDGTVLSLTGTAKMRNSVFTGNYIGGSLRGNLNGVITVAGTAELENCVIYGNYTQASASGDDEGFTGRYSGGIYVPNGSPLIRNCIVRSNMTSAEGDTKNHTVEKNWYVLSAAIPRISHCNTPDAPEGAMNCQTGDPKFAKPDFAETYDFSIAADSPCVDAGKGRGWRKGATDYAGNPRIQGRRVDIGAYEYNNGVKDWGLQILVR